MSRDPWLSQLRVAGSDPSAVERVLAGGVPDDGQQQAGQAAIRCTASTELISTVTTLIGSLSQRNWSGDPELIAELEHVRDATTSELSLLAADLDEIGEALDQSPAGVSYLDLATATLWPAEILDVDQGLEDFDPDGSERWLPIAGAGSQPAYAVMERFIATIDSPDLASRLRPRSTGPLSVRVRCTPGLRNDQSPRRAHSRRYLERQRMSVPRLGRTSVLRTQ